MGILGVQGRGEGCTLSSNSRFSAFSFGSWYSTPCCRGAQRAAHFFSMARTGGRKSAGLTAYRPDSLLCFCLGPRPHTVRVTDVGNTSSCGRRRKKKKKKKKKKVLCVDPTV